MELHARHLEAVGVLVMRGALDTNLGISSRDHQDRTVGMDALACEVVRALDERPFKAAPE